MGAGKREQGREKGELVLRNGEERSKERSVEERYKTH